MAVAAGPAGNVHLAGQTGGALGGQTSAGELDAFVRTYDREGNEGWTRQFGGAGAAAAGLAVEPGGSVYVAGWTYGALPGQTPFGQYDAFVRKNDTGGSEVWTRQFGTPEHDRATRVAVDPTGNIDVAAGGSRGNVRRDSFARRYDPNGAEVQTRRLQASEIEDIRAVAVDPPGNIYIAGQTDVDHGHAFVRKYDLQGHEAWTRELHLADSEVLVVDVAVDPSGDVYVAGQAGDGQSDVFVRKYDRNGTEVWTSQLATSENDVASSLIVDPAGNVYLVGWTDGHLAGQTSAGRSDAFIAKLK